MGKKLTHEEFISQVLKINPNIEILSLYGGDKVKVRCRCKICNYEWEDTPTHIKGGRTCGNCKRIELQNKNAIEFFTKSSIVHNNKYDYSKFKYIDSYTKGIIICPIHGEFLLIPNSHIKGRGCPKCAGNNYKRTSEEFIERAKKVHGDKYDYSKIIYRTCKDKVLIKCNQCGNEFYLTPDHHLSGKGCPNCILVGQTKLYEKLKETFPSEEILFEVGSSIIPWLEKQRFDIYFPKYNIAVEYNGKLHYVPIEHFGGVMGFNKTILRDKLKEQKCIDNNCHLFQVKYDYTNEEYILLSKSIQLIINNYYGRRN